MPGCWFIEDGEYVWKDAEPPTAQVEVSDNPVVDVLFGPKGEVVATWLAREPIGFKPTRWAKNRGKS